MVYCSKCGTGNEDDAVFCKKCGNSLAPHAAAPPHPPARDKDWDDDCDRNCYGTRQGKSWFWGVILVIVGIWIIFEFVIKENFDLPKDIEDFEFWWVIAVIIGIMIIIAGIRSLTRSDR